MLEATAFLEEDKPVKSKVNSVVFAFFGFVSTVLNAVLFYELKAIKLVEGAKNWFLIIF